MKRLVYILLFIPLLTMSQNLLKGTVNEGDTNNITPVFGANVYWAGTTVGVVTQEDGSFEIPYQPEYKNLVISYIGYKTQTIQVNKLDPITIHLQESDQLDEVVVSAERKATQLSYLNQRNVVTINEKELLKAACCNLSESFETNPSIDVSFSDAVTGTKHIEMLGLTNPYILITQENIPSIRGASQAHGLTFTPGTWLESIQITKGAGSVVNGFESIAGQINTELKKPFSDDRLYINAYGSMNGRVELNTHFNQKLNEKWSSGIFVHANQRNWRRDMNDDNFIDAPLMNQLNIMNRWQYSNSESGWVSFFDLRYMKDDKLAGEMDFRPEEHRLTTTKWGSEINTKRFDVSNKTGYVFKDTPYKTLGLQTAYSNHDQESYFGLRRYDIKHQSLYSNFIYNSIISNTRNTFKTGLSFTYDQYDEFVIDTNYKRNENSLGAFFEYTFDNGDNFSVVAGVRADTHNLLGEFITPRLHVRYNPWEKAVLRGSIGRGKRSASIFAENQQYFASSRAINVIDEGGNIYGLNPEIAWNYGGSFLQGFNVFGKKGDISVEYYATDFKKKVVVDVDSNTNAVSFYDLKGKSIAHSFQTDLNYNLAKHFDFRFSYKFYDVLTDYNSGSLTQPLLAKHRLFGNLSYQTHFLNAKGSRWKFDATWNWIGKKRIPNTTSNPSQYQLKEFSNPFNRVNLQVTKVFSQQFEVYLGAENLFGYRQDNPILAADDPFGPYFDSTMIYAPVQGARVYSGLRFNIK